MQGAYLLATFALLVACAAVVMARGHTSALARARLEVGENVGRARAEFTQRLRTAREEGEVEVARLIDGARVEMMGLIDSRAQGLLAEVEGRVVAAQDGVAARVRAALAEVEVPLMEQVKATVAAEAVKQRQAASDLIEQAEDTIARLRSEAGKAMRTVRTAKTRVQDLEDDDEDDEDDSNDLVMSLAAHLPAEVRQGILEHAPPETRAQVNLMFAAADARAGQSGQAPAQGPQQARVPTPPAGFGV